MAFDQFGNFINPMTGQINTGSPDPRLIDGGSNPYTVNASNPVIDGGSNPFNVTGGTGDNVYGQPMATGVKSALNLKTGGASTQPVNPMDAIRGTRGAVMPYQQAGLPPATTAPTTQPTNQAPTPYNFNSSGPEQQQAMSAYYDQTNGNYAQRQTTFNGLTTDADRIAYLKQNPDMLNQLNSQYGAGFKQWFDQSDASTRGGMYDQASNTNYDVAGTGGTLPTRSWQSTVNPAITQGQVASAQQMNGGGQGYTGATGAVNAPDPINAQQNASMASAAGTPGSSTWNTTSQSAWDATRNGTAQPTSSVPTSNPNTPAGTPTLSTPDSVSNTTTNTTSNPYLNAGGNSQSQPNYYQPTSSAQNNIYGSAGSNTAAAPTSGAYQINPSTYMKGWG